ncbi:MAG: glycosyltransferase family 2 protein [Elusimicrobiales bacterium]
MNGIIPSFFYHPAARDALVIFSNTVQMYLFTVWTSYFVMSFWGLKKRVPLPAPGGRLNRFAVVLPAYNEEEVIGHAVESLFKLDYPRELFDVWVVADHCTDRTAEIAKSRGANVFLNDGDSPRGKARALLALDRSLLETGKYDAFCYFDADSLAHPGFLRAMSDHLNAGHQAMQGMERSKNPDFNFLSRICHVGKVMQIYYGQLPKYRLGLSATLHGKGMCFSADIVRRFPWDPRALTEDIELQARLIRHGVPIYYAPQAVVFDESPVTMRQMVLRSLRWTKGALYAANKHIWGTFRRFLMHGDLRALESFSRFSMCYRLLLVGSAAALIYIYRDAFNLLYWIFDHPSGARFSVKLMNWIPVYLWPAYALYRERSGWRDYATYIVMPWFYLFLGIPIFAASVFSYKRSSHWYRTEHGCAVSISELVEGKRC